jgi:integrase
MTSKEFQSIFKDEFQELIAVKRALGFKYQSEEGLFLRIDAFLSEHNLSEKKISRELCEEWCRKRSYESHANHCHRVSEMRVFCRYLNDIGLSAYIPPINMTRNPPKYDAHIYTEDELKRFFSAVDKSQSVPSECPYRGEVMPLFFRILYTSGLRVSELRLARIKDVNLERGYIFVHGGKNKKDRIVPIHPELVEKCKTLKASIHKNSPEDEFFFMQYPGRAMPLVNVYHNFRRYLDKAGISHTGKGPRVHDFRHTYCVNLLLKWSKEGKDLMVYLPYMRTMLGHEGFEETAYYLKLTADAFPVIRESLNRSFPSIIDEATFNDHEYY